MSKFFMQRCDGDQNIVAKNDVLLSNGCGVLSCNFVHTCFYPRIVDQDIQSNVYIELTSADAPNAARACPLRFHASPANGFDSKA